MTVDPLSGQEDRPFVGDSAVLSATGGARPEAAPGAACRSGAFVPSASTNGCTADEHASALYCQPYCQPFLVLPAVF